LAQEVLASQLEAITLIYRQFPNTFVPDISEKRHCCPGVQFETCRAEMRLSSRGAANAPVALTSTLRRVSFMLSSFSCLCLEGSDCVLDFCCRGKKQIGGGRQLED
jgi:hypothetical protein